MKQPGVVSGQTHVELAPRPNSHAFCFSVRSVRPATSTHAVHCVQSFADATRRGNLAMKVLGISGSPRPGGNTDILVMRALEVVAKEGLETEFVSLADRPIKPC
ncbi:MAG: flavodoxin family protein, partial [Planctomycetota bacterium]